MTIVFITLASSKLGKVEGIATSPWPL